MGYIFAILGLSLLIVVHELGHMLLARFFGMRVEKFSVGFGPTLLRWQGRQTTYQIALIPLGGFVQIAGMNPHEQLPKDDPGSYMNKSSWARFSTIFAGPLTNYLLAMVMMIGVMLIWGLPHWQNKVEQVDANSPAAQGGMRSGDVIRRINDQKVSAITDVLEKIQASKGQPLTFEVARGDESAKLTIQPSRQGEAFRIGIKFGQQLSFAEVGVGGALIAGLLYPVQVSQQALTSLGGWIADKLAGKSTGQQVGGPVEIVHQLKVSFEHGVATAILFLAMLSAYLGLFNLLPIPALDGGRLLFLISTMVIRRPINQRFENAVHTIGFFLLLILIALVTYKDIARRIGGD